jgi:hypothetical protein
MDPGDRERITPTAEPHSYTRIRRSNLIAGVVHLAQAIMMLALSSDLSLPITVSYLRDDPIQVRRGVAPETLFDVPVGPLVALFLLLAAIDHLVIASPWGHAWYERNLSRGINVARWVEYSMSASLMVVLICLFVGIRDIAALLGLFGVNSAMILFGWLMERHQTPGRADWAAFWFGCFAGSVPWVAIWWYVLGTDRVPGFVYAVTLTQLILFTAFALNQAFQYAQVGRWRSYLFGESTYITLSLVAKSLLAWIIYANVLRPA